MQTVTNKILTDWNTIFMQKISNLHYSAILSFINWNFFVNLGWNQIYSDFIFCCTELVQKNNERISWGNCLGSNYLKGYYPGVDYPWDGYLTDIYYPLIIQAPIAWGSSFLEAIVCGAIQLDRNFPGAILLESNWLSSHCPENNCLRTVKQHLLKAAWIWN